MNAIPLAWCLLLAAAVPVCAEGQGAADALARCRETFAVPWVEKGENAAHGSAGVTLTKVDGTWQATEASLWFEYPHGGSKGGLEDVVLQRLAGLKTLRAVRVEGSHGMSDCNPTPAGVQALAKLRELRELTAPASLTGEGLKAICASPLLEDLYLYRCECLKDADMAALAKHPTLRVLRRDAIDDQTATLTDASLKVFASMPALERLETGKADFSDTGLAVLLGAAKLRELDLGTCERVTDKGLATLAGMPNLTGLKVAKLGSMGIGELRKAARLERLEVGFLAAGNGGVYFDEYPALKALAIRDAETAKVKSMTIPDGLEELRIPYELGPKINLFCTRPDRLSRLTLDGLFFAREDGNDDPARNRAPRDLAWLSKLPALADVELSTCRDDDVVVAVSHVKGLRGLKLTGACALIVGEADARALATVSGLESFETQIMPFVTDAGMADLGRLTRLKRLDVGWLRCWGENEGLSDAGFASLGGLKNLRVLRGTDTPPAAAKAYWRFVTGLENLEELSLAGVLRDEEARGLSRLRNLRTLTVACSDAALAELMEAMPRLEKVTRSYTMPVSGSATGENEGNR